MPSLSTMRRFINVGVSSRTVELAMGATKSSGLRHLRCITSQNSARERVGVLEGGLMGMVWDWVRVTILDGVEWYLFGSLGEEGGGVLSL